MFGDAISHTLGTGASVVDSVETRYSPTTPNFVAIGCMFSCS